ncbi:putative two-component system response regulator [Allochromatium warmingii]|uniref:Putative two-component system response regulator n=1 Tax=Allochromatium warmingii TaxID=61595 RepID=A0A1H3GSD0_ALLWA|nr:HD domain-containing phosphohydrolase [Allochromatium warmingii]SDY05384.1 putative two-component system response regulator [Allochromatium warmingii]
MLPARLLIVDDEPANLAVLRQILEPHYALLFARHGADALELARRHHPNLILLDIEMPGLDGYSVCRALKADPQTEAIPVIFVTALSELDDEELGFEVGCVDYLVKPVSAGIVRARVRAHLSLVQAKQLDKSYRDALAMLAKAGHYNDSDTGMHVWRMAAYARALAEAIGWSASRCELLELAAPMHDTGKIGIPDAILRKPGKLDADEWTIMRTHSQLGHDILVSSDAPIFQLAAEIALCHHEHWNGGGYPHGLSGEAIPESARIVAIADVFDALTMKRPYKEAWPIEQTLATMQVSSGEQFEPRLMTCFIEILPRILEIKAEWERREGA